MFYGNRGYGAVTLLYCFVMGLVVVADQLSKNYIVQHFVMHQITEVVPNFFNLVYFTNKGAAFSFLADVESAWRHYFFVTLTAAAVIGISFFYSSVRNENKIYGVALGCISGGALGNLIDRIRFGAVVDFLDFYIKDYHWPAFNVADSAICIGAILFMIVNIFFTEK